MIKKNSNNILKKELVYFLLHSESNRKSYVKIGKSDSDWRKSFLFEYYRDSEWPHAGPNQVAVRTMEFKLVESFIENDIDELYDLVNDPGEMNNLINESRFDEKEHELRLESLRLQKKYKYNPDRDWHLRTIVKNRKFNN